MWCFSESETAADYRIINYHLYGTAEVSFLANRILHQLDQDESPNFPVGSKIMLLEFCVDDLMTKSRSIWIFHGNAAQSDELTCKCGFELRKCIQIV